MIALCKFLFLFVFGGSIYYGIEMFTRGFSHWSMFILGGICFILCGRLNEKQRGTHPAGRRIGAAPADDPLIYGF